MITQDELEQLRLHLTRALNQLGSAKVQLIRKADWKIGDDFFKNELELTDAQRQQILSELMQARAIVYVGQARDKDGQDYRSA